jgi:hypothetical protein
LWPSAGYGAPSCSAEKTITGFQIGLAELAEETGAKPVSVSEAARSGEAVIVTIPEKNISKLPLRFVRGDAR